MVDNFAIVLDYCMRIVHDLQSLAFNLLDWFTETYNFAGLELSYYELFFGSALTLVLTYAIVKFFVGIIV